MYKIIGADGKEYGPVTAEQLRDWIAQGRANVQTMVQAEGSADWKPLTAFAEFADVLGAAPPLLPPLTAGPVDTQTFAAQIAARDYRLEIGSCIGRGWELFKGNLGTLLGGTLMVLVVQVVVSIVPFVGWIGQLILTGVLTGGMFWLYIRAIRGESGGVGDAFAGFSRGFVQLMLGHIVTGLLAALAILPGAILLGIGVVVHAAARSHGHTLIGVPVLVVGGVLLAAAIPVTIYLSTCWYFTLPLIIDKQLDFWAAMKLSRAMVRKHWWNVFGVMFVSGLVALAGIFACGIGMLFTIPIAIGSMMYAYEDIFGSAPTTT